MSAQVAEVIEAVVPGAKRAEDESSEDAVASACDEEAVIVALADGAGSAAQGGYGAQLAVASAVESLQESLSDKGRPLAEALIVAIHDARRTLQVVARAQRRDEASLRLKDLATTLSVAVLNRSQLGLASVGDGIHVLRDVHGELIFAAMAADTEIANQTRFVTGEDLDGAIEVMVHDVAEIESVLLSSDGLDSQLVGRRDDERWPLSGIANSLLNAPILEGWGSSDYKRLLTSDVIRQHSDDDCSLALIRRPIRRSRSSTEVAGLILTPVGDLPTGRQAWAVGGCADLLAVELSPAVPAGAAIARRTEQVWERSYRYPPVSWPIRRIGDNLVLFPCPPADAQAIGPRLSRSRRHRRDAVLAGVRKCVEALHDAGLAHGQLSLECFALHPDGSVGLRDPGPGMFEGTDREALVTADKEFLARFEQHKEVSTGRGERRRVLGRRRRLRRGREA